MTNNMVFLSQNGEEMVQVNRADGLGVSEIKKLGIKQIIISTEKNPVVTSRAKKLDIPCFQGVENKLNVLLKYCQLNEIDLDDIIYVGNDINDKDAMEVAGTTFCPSDAHESIKEISTYKLKNKGGEGVVRELLNFLNKEKE